MGIYAPDSALGQERLFHHLLSALLPLAHVPAHVPHSCRFSWVLVQWLVWCRENLHPTRIDCHQLMRVIGARPVIVPICLSQHMIEWISLATTYPIIPCD